jgi:hypothetical protein
MSRNFELLRRAGREQSIFPSTDVNEFDRADTRTPVARTDFFPREPNSEFHRLVQRMFLLPGLEKRRVIVFSQVDQPATPSWICPRSADVLAASVQGQICVLDADIECPTVHEHFGFRNTHGFSDLLVDAAPIDKFVQWLPGEKIGIIPAGRGVSVDLAAVGSILAGRILELRRLYDFVLIQAPPVAYSSAAAILGQVADGIVLILEAHATRKDEAKRAKDILAAAEVNVIGAVLNNRTFPIPEAIYSRL